MTPTADSDERWGRSGSGRFGAPQFGATSRGSYRPRGFFERMFGDDDDDEDRASRGTFRTMCVRLCDGFYWPISFSVSRDRFQHDAAVCESSCGEQARLFVYPNPGGAIEDMQDLQGRPYRQLRTAFLYRTEYMPACKCQPHPWEEASRDRHRMYALAAAKRRGDKAADKEMAALAAKLQREAQEAAGRKTASLPGPQYDGQPATADERPRTPRSEVAEAEERQKAAARSREERAREAETDPGRRARIDEWRRRLFMGN